MACSTAAVVLLCFWLRICSVPSLSLGARRSSYSTAWKLHSGFTTVTVLITCYTHHEVITTVWPDPYSLTLQNKSMMQSWPPCIEGLASRLASFSVISHTHYTVAHVNPLPIHFCGYAHILTYINLVSKIKPCHEQRVMFTRPRWWHVSVIYLTLVSYMYTSTQLVIMLVVNLPSMTPLWSLSNHATKKKKKKNSVSIPGHTGLFFSIISILCCISVSRASMLHNYDRGPIRWDI